jgi:hypothetical protein
MPEGDGDRIWRITTDVPPTVLRYVLHFPSDAGSPAGRSSATMWPMVASKFVKARLSLALKQRVKAQSEGQLLSESAWLRQLIVRALLSADGGGSSVPASTGSVADRHRNRDHERRQRCVNRLYARLRREGHLLLQARASARGLRCATYVSALTRCHVRRVIPLPKEEFLALKRGQSASKMGLKLLRPESHATVSRISDVAHEVDGARLIGAGCRRRGNRSFLLLKVIRRLESGLWSIRRTERSQELAVQKRGEQATRVPIRVLIAVMLLLNGLAVPPASASHTSTGATSPSHDGHGQDSAPADPGPEGLHSHQSNDVSNDIAGGDCCEASGCDCGCAAPQATTLPVSLPRVSWRLAPSQFTFAVKSFHSSPLSTPFRPPA